MSKTASIWNWAVNKTKIRGRHEFKFSVALRLQTIRTAREGELSIDSCCLPAFTNRFITHRGRKFTAGCQHTVCEQNMYLIMFFTLHIYLYYSVIIYCHDLKVRTGEWTLFLRDVREEETANLGTSIPQPNRKSVTNLWDIRGDHAVGTASVTEDWNSGPLPSGASSLGQKSANTDLDATSRGRLSDMCTQQNRSGPSTSFLKTVVILKKKKKKFFYLAMVSRLRSSKHRQQAFETVVVVAEIRQKAHHLT